MVADLCNACVTAGGQAAHSSGAAQQREGDAEPCGESAALLVGVELFEG